MRSCAVILGLLGLLGCATGEGVRTYVIGDVYVFPPPGAVVSVLNQVSVSETGRDRVIKPSAEATVPVSALP